MVFALKRMAFDVVGCRQFLAASASICAQSSPVSGGALSRGPMMEKRSLAQRTRVAPVSSSTMVNTSTSTVETMCAGGWANLCVNRFSLRAPRKKRLNVHRPRRQWRKPSARNGQHLADIWLIAKPFSYPLDKRTRQERLVDGRHQTPAHPEPGGRRWQRRRPPRKPTTDGLHRHARHSRDAAHPREQHLHAHEDDDRLQVDAPAEKPDRRWQDASTAPLPTAAQPKPPAEFFASRRHQPATRLALEVPGVEGSTTCRTAQGACVVGERLVNDDETNKHRTVRTGFVPQ